MFEVQYNEQMEAEIQRLESKKRAVEAGHPEWDNACGACGCELGVVTVTICDICR